jgi:hypothetical protein
VHSRREKQFNVILADELHVLFSQSQLSQVSQTYLKSLKKLIFTSNYLFLSSKRGMIKVQKCTFIAYAIPMLEEKVKFAFKRKPTNVIYDSLKLIRWA